MVYGPPKFEEGKRLYEQGKNARDAGNWEAAKLYFSQARDIFFACKGQHPEAKSLYQEIQAILGG